MPLDVKKARAVKRETRKAVRQSQRDIDRDMRDLDRTETQVVRDIKKRARAPGVNPATDTSVKTLAKQLVQIRNQKEKLIKAKAQIGAMEMQTTLMAAQLGAATAVGSVTGAMKTVNEAMQTTQVIKMMTEFERQNEIMIIKGEMMDDAIEVAFDTDEIEEGAEEITSHVLAELGVELEGNMAGLNAPMSKLSISQESRQEDDFNARLNAL